MAKAVDRPPPLKEFNREETQMRGNSCEFGSGSNKDLARRRHLLQLLALVEHPDALPADAALRLGREILALTRRDRARAGASRGAAGPAVEEAR